MSGFTDIDTVDPCLIRDLFTLTHEKREFKDGGGTPISYYFINIKSKTQPSKNVYFYPSEDLFSFGIQKWDDKEKKNKQTFTATIILAKNRNENKKDAIILTEIEKNRIAVLKEIENMVYEYIFKNKKELGKWSTKLRSVDSIRDQGGLSSLVKYQEYQEGENEGQTDPSKSPLLKLKLYTKPVYAKNENGHNIKERKECDEISSVFRDENSQQIVPDIDTRFYSRPIFTVSRYFINNQTIAPQTFLRESYYIPLGDVSGTTMLPARTPESLPPRGNIPDYKPQE